MEQREAEDADVESAEEGGLQTAPPRKMLLSSVSPTRSACPVSRMYNMQKVQWKTSKLTSKRFKVPISRCEYRATTVAAISQRLLLHVGVHLLSAPSRTKCFDKYW